MILIYGPMGAGKTTVARILNSKLKRTAHIGLDRIKSFISDFKRNHNDNEISRNVMLAMVHEYFKQGINVMIEQVMGEKHIEIFTKIAKKYDARLFVYQIEAPKELLNSRIIKRTQASGKKPTPKSIIERSYKFHLENKYNKATIFNSEKMSPKEIANSIIKDLKRK